MSSTGIAFWPSGIQLGFQGEWGPGRVVVRGVSDSLTMAGMLAALKTITSYHQGLSAGTVLNGYPSSTPAGGAPPLPTVCLVTPSLIRVGVKDGDEQSLLASLKSVLITAGNATSNGWASIPGPLPAGQN